MFRRQRPNQLTEEGMLMKKTYEIPEAKLIIVNVRDIITLSYNEDSASVVNAIDVGELERWF